jgi:hypothetical protein
MFYLVTIPEIQIKATGRLHLVLAPLILPGLLTSGVPKLKQAKLVVHQVWKILAVLISTQGLSDLRPSLHLNNRFPISLRAFKSLGFFSQQI